MANHLQFDVFLSHSSKDKAVVRPLAEQLRAEGLKIWFDEWEIKPGDSIPAKIEEGLEHSRVLVLCMSANAFGSDWSQLESGTFRFRDPLNRERRFIPLRLDDAPIKDSLAQFLHINWRAADRGQEYTKLLEACLHPAKWPQAAKKKADKASALSRSARKGFDRLHADGLDRTEVLRAIREFHRAIWDYKDSQEWVGLLSRAPKTRESREEAMSRDATREYCGNRNVSAWQKAAATLPIILRAGERLGLPTNDFKNLIANSPHSPEWLEGVEDVVRQMEARLGLQGTGFSSEGER